MKQIDRINARLDSMERCFNDCLDMKQFRMDELHSMCAAMMAKLNNKVWLIFAMAFFGIINM